MMKSTEKKTGLTLIEVLIALVILSVGVSALTISMSSCLSVVRTARHRENARMLFQLLEVENPLLDEELGELSESGEFEDEKMAGYKWEREVHVVDAENRPGLFLIRTRISWSERGKDAFEEIYTYRYVPTAESVTREF